MLDRGMQEFAAEMQAKARVRRPRPVATRRAELIGNLSAAGAAELARRIKAYWAGVGYSNVVTEIVACGRHGEIPTYGVRSNLKSGLPPQGGANGHHG